MPGRHFLGYEAWIEAGALGISAALLFGVGGACVMLKPGLAVGIFVLAGGCGYMAEFYGFADMQPWVILAFILAIIVAVNMLIAKKGDTAIAGG